ncbi:MAG: hypothetical protein AB1665_05815, partial [Candidatus Thermoplasmatota archaeon]
MPNGTQAAGAPGTEAIPPPAAPPKKGKGKLVAAVIAVVVVIVVILAVYFFMFSSPLIGKWNHVSTKTTTEVLGQEVTSWDNS